MKIVIQKNNIKKRLTDLSYVLVVCLAVMRAMQFHVHRSDNMDLARHFHMMELVKQSGYSFFEYVFVRGNAFTSNITLKFSYAFNAIVYLICKNTTNYYLISWLFVLIDYSIILYIGVDWWRSQGGRKPYMFFSEVLLCFSLLPFIHAVSGLRTAIAACIMALAIYLYMYKNKSVITFAVIALISSTFHVAFITAIPFVLLAKRIDQRKGLLIAIAGSVSVSVIANLFIRSKNSFLYSIAYKYLQYTGEGGYTSARFCYYGVLIICILSLSSYFYLFFWRKRKKNQKNAKRRNHSDYPRVEIYDFVAYYMIFIVTNIGHYEMVLRPAYLLGAMAPIVTGLVYGSQGKLRKRSFISTIIVILLFIITTYVSAKYVIWHSEYFV